MPAGISRTERRIPFQHMVRVGLPQHEIARIFLGRLMLRTNATALALAQILKRVSRKFAVVSETFDIEIHRAVAGHIRVVALNKLLDHVKHL